MTVTNDFLCRSFRIETLRVVDIQAGLDRTKVTSRGRGRREAEDMHRVYALELLIQFIDTFYT